MKSRGIFATTIKQRCNTGGVSFATPLIKCLGLAENDSLGPLGFFWLHLQVSSAPLNPVGMATAVRALLAQSRLYHILS